MISFPPRASNAFKFALAALKVTAYFSSRGSTPVSKLNVRKSHAGSPNTISEKKPFPNTYWRLLLGAGPVTHSGQPPGPSSPPTENPGKIELPFESRGPE